MPAVVIEMPSTTQQDRSLENSKEIKFSDEVFGKNIQEVRATMAIVGEQWVPGYLVCKVWRAILVDPIMKSSEFSKKRNKLCTSIPHIT